MIRRRPHVADYGVIVIGAKDAVLSDMVSAQTNGAERVLVPEKQPPEWRGGNTHLSAATIVA